DGRIFRRAAGGARSARREGKAAGRVAGAPSGRGIGAPWHPGGHAAGAGFRRAAAGAAVHAALGSRPGTEAIERRARAISAAVPVLLTLDFLLGRPDSPTRPSP